MFNFNPQEKKDNKNNNNINDMLSFLGGSSLGGTQKKKFTFFEDDFSKKNSNKDNSQLSSKNNYFFKSFNYQEDKNLKYRQSMEDIGIMIPDLTTDYKVSLFGIFDGHGGNDVVQFVKDRLPQLIKNHLNDLCPVDLAFKNSFEKVDQELRFFDSEYIGTTATIVLFKDNKIYCANVGDSKAYIIYEKTYKQISSDHKCTVEDEAQRVRKMGGKITKNRVMGN